MYIPLPSSSVTMETELELCLVGRGEPGQNRCERDVEGVALSGVTSYSKLLA